MMERIEMPEKHGCVGKQVFDRTKGKCVISVQEKWRETW